MSNTRDQIIETTGALIELQGYQATGLNQIIQESGAPKGSLYYYFPGGKEALIAEAIEQTGQTIAARIRSGLAEIDRPSEAVESFILTLARHVAASDFQAGGPITTVALEAANTSERLNVTCRMVYDSWQYAFAEKLVQSGYSPQRAARLAALIIATIEGAIILSRTARRVTPLEHAAKELSFLLQTVEDQQ